MTCPLSLLMSLRFCFSKSGIFFLLKVLLGALLTWVFWGVVGWLVHFPTLPVVETRMVEAGCFDVAP